MTARTHPILILVVAEAAESGVWQLSHSGMSSNLTLDPATFSDKYEDVVVWENTVNGQRVLEEADTWFSKIVGETVKLIYFGDKSNAILTVDQRCLLPFADGYPFLLTTQASLLELNRTCP